MKRIVLLTAICIATIATAAPAGSGQPGWLGLGFTYEKATTSRAQPQPFLYVRQLAPSGPAQAAGVKPQDVITAIDGRAIWFRDTAEAVDFLHRLRSGDAIVLTIRRQQKVVRIRVIAVPLPREYERLRKLTERAARSQRR